MVRPLLGPDLPEAGIKIVLGVSHTVKEQEPFRVPSPGFQREVGGPVIRPGPRGQLADD